MKGYILNKYYIVLDKIGEGTYSNVWIAYNILQKKYFAIKIFNTYDYNNGLYEIEILKKINKYIEHFKYKKHICIVNILYTGSLYDLITKSKYKNGLPIKMVKEITKQILLQLDDLHYNYNLIHTDLKPENIFFNGYNDNINNIINNFNDICLKYKTIKKIANELKDKNYYHKYYKFLIENKIKLKPEKITTKYNIKFNNTINKVNNIYLSHNINNNYDINSNINITVGDFGNCINKIEKNTIQTRYYRAPEIILKQKYNNKIDIWSIGCIIFELLTGHILFDPYSQINSNKNIYHLELIKKKLTFGLHNILKNNFHFSLKNSLEVSDFLSNLLQIDINKRYDTKQCLNHNWLK